MATTGLPGPLSGRVVHSIDYTPAVEAFKFSISHAPPLTFYAGFAGPIGIARRSSLRRGAWIETPGQADQGWKKALSLLSPEGGVD